MDYILISVLNHSWYSPRRCCLTEHGRFVGRLPPPFFKNSIPRKERRVGLRVESGKKNRTLFFFHASIGVVVVDGFQVFGFHPEPGDIGVGVKAYSNIADDILYEHGILICFLGDELFVRAFEKGINRCAGRFFHHPDQVLNPEKLPKGHFYGDQASLVVGSPITDFLRTRAKGGNRDRHSHHQGVTAVG